MACQWTGTMITWIMATSFISCFGQNESQGRLSFRKHPPFWDLGIRLQFETSRRPNPAEKPEIGPTF